MTKQKHEQKQSRLVHWPVCERLSTHGVRTIGFIHIYHSPQIKQKDMTACGPHFATRDLSSVWEQEEKRMMSPFIEVFLWTFTSATHCHREERKGVTMVGVSVKAAEEEEAGTWSEIRESLSLRKHLHTQWVMADCQDVKEVGLSGAIEVSEWHPGTNCPSATSHTSDPAPLSLWPPSPPESWFTWGSRFSSSLWPRQRQEQALSCGF